LSVFFLKYIYGKSFILPLFLSLFISPLSTLSARLLHLRAGLNLPHLALPLPTLSTSHSSVLRHTSLLLPHYAFIPSSSRAVPALPHSASTLPIPCRHRLAPPPPSLFRALPPFACPSSSLAPIVGKIEQHRTLGSREQEGAG